MSLTITIDSLIDEKLLKIWASFSWMVTHVAPRALSKNFVGQGNSSRPMIVKLITQPFPQYPHFQTCKYQLRFAY